MPNWRTISEAWAAKEFVDGSDRKKVAAIERVLPLLEDPTAVPFVCRVSIH